MHPLNSIIFNILLYFSFNFEITDRIKSPILFLPTFSFYPLHKLKPYLSLSFISYQLHSLLEPFNFIKVIMASVSATSLLKFQPSLKLSTNITSQVQKPQTLLFYLFYVFYHFMYVLLLIVALKPTRLV